MNSWYSILTVILFFVRVQQSQTLQHFERGVKSAVIEAGSSGVSEDFDRLSANVVQRRFVEHLKFGISGDPIQSEDTVTHHVALDVKPQASNVGGIDTYANDERYQVWEQQVEDLPPIIASDSLSIADKCDESQQELNGQSENPPPLIAIDPIVTATDFAEGNIRSGPCSIGTNNGDLPMNQPLLVSPATNEILQPTKAGFVSFETGDSVNLYCTGSFADPFNGKEKITAFCVVNSTFSVDNQLYVFSEIRCESMVGNLMRKTPRTCYNGAAVIEVGFDLEDIFIQLMEICHNINKHVSHYVHYPMGPYLSGYQSGIPRPIFVPGGFFGGADVNQLYTQVQQKLTLEQILGYDTKGYFNVAANIYMARGHLAAKVDFVYAPAQWATFFFTNTAPQWQTFNGGNWERIEYGVRRFTGDRDLDLDIYSGIWGVMSLPNVEGVHTPLYLAFDENGEGLIPVPKIYWRVIIDKVSQLGVALIGVNNIHAKQEDIDQEYILCNDVSDMIDWIPWDKKNILKGYSYACEVNDLIERIGLLPIFNVTGLLY